MVYVSNPIWRIALLCVQRKTLDDGQRNWPKYVAFYSTNKFGKLTHLVGFIIRIFHDARLHERQILTYSMVQTPSWEANWFAASQEIPRISRNPKVHYRTYKRLPHVPILGQPNPVHIPTSNLLEIHPNIIHPSTPRSPQWFLPSGFLSKTLYTTLSSPIRATCPTHLILLDFITRTILGEEYKSRRKQLKATQ